MDLGWKMEHASRERHNNKKPRDLRKKEEQAHPVCKYVSNQTQWYVA